MNYNTALKPKIAPESTKKYTCATCPKFIDFGEARGRGWCTLFDNKAFLDNPQVDDCRLNLATEAKAKDKTIDAVGKQIQETRSLLNKSKRRLSIKNQLVLKAPF